MEPALLCGVLMQTKSGYTATAIMIVANILKNTEIKRQWHISLQLMCWGKIPHCFEGEIIEYITLRYYLGVITVYACACVRMCVCMHVYVCLHVCLGKECKVHHYISILENSITNIARKSENVL